MEYYPNWTQKLKALNMKVESIVSIATFISILYKESLLSSYSFYSQVISVITCHSKCNIVKIRKYSNLQVLEDIDVIQQGESR